MKLLLLLCLLLTGCQNYATSNSKPNRPKLFQITLYAADGSVIKEWHTDMYWHGEMICFYDSESGNYIRMNGTFVVERVKD